MSQEVIDYAMWCLSIQVTKNAVLDEEFHTKSLRDWLDSFEPVPEKLLNTIAGYFVKVGEQTLLRSYQYDAIQFTLLPWVSEPKLYIENFNVWEHRYGPK